MIAISSNGFSVDLQIDDAVTALTDAEAEAFLIAFPEYQSLRWEGAWIDPEASKVDVDFMNWVCDWIEANTDIFWEEGEPWRREESDNESAFDDPDFN